MIERAWAWVTGEKHSLYGLAVTRIMLGFIISTQLMANFPDRHYTWGDGAMWTDSVRSGRGWPGFLDVMFVGSDGHAFDVVYIATIVVGLLLMVGFCTRASTILALFLWMSLYVSNPFVGNGGDVVLRMVLLYMCFVDSGSHWSVDEWLSRRRGKIVRRTPAWLSATVHNVALVLIIHQVVMVYVASALWKVQSRWWTGGTAVYYPLQTEAFSPWRDHIHLLTDHGWIVALASYTAIGVQLLVPVLLIYRPTRFFGLVALTGMHLGIGILMGILYFSLVMIAVDVLLISDRSWSRAEHETTRFLNWLHDKTRKPAKTPAIR
ncbi:MAG: HTTM domain-containing protein [Aeromicrobium sp.]